MDGPRQLHIEKLLRTRRFDVEKVTYPLDDGTLVSREIVRHPGAVVVIPVLEDGRICLIKNYRVAINSVILELPAGTREPNEPPLVTAGRELIEETGYRADSIEPLCELAMSPGILDERMFVFLAQKLKPGEPNREVGEEMQNVLATADEVDRLIYDNAIQDAKSIAALLYYLRFRLRTTSQTNA